jgi:hypothetical protein
MPTSILIQDESLLLQIEQVRLGRKDGTVTKTAKDLLREKIIEIQKDGDRMAVPEPDAA